MSCFGISVNAKEAYKKHAYKTIGRRRGYIWLNKTEKQMALLRAIEKLNDT